MKEIVFNKTGYTFIFRYDVNSDDIKYAFVKGYNDKEFLVFNFIPGVYFVIFMQYFISGETFFTSFDD